MPLGPKLVLTRSESSLTAWIFRKTASSNPWRCFFSVIRWALHVLNLNTLYPSLKIGRLLDFGTFNDILEEWRAEIQHSHHLFIQIINLPTILTHVWSVIAMQLSTRVKIQMDLLKSRQSSISAGLGATVHYYKYSSVLKSVRGDVPKGFWYVEAVKRRHIGR